MLREWRKNFLAGFLIVLPLALTLGIIGWVFKKIDNLVITQIINLLPQDWIESGSARFFWKLVALGVVVGILTFIGVITRNVLGKKLLEMGEFIVAKIPLINKIYTSVKEIRDSFIGGKKEFNRTVLVEYPSKGIYTVGFVVNPAPKEVSEKLGQEALGIILPTTPNPTSGWMVFLPEREVIHLKMSVEDAMKLIISGGTIKI